MLGRLAKIACLLALGLSAAVSAQQSAEESANARLAAAAKAGDLAEIRQALHDGASVNTAVLTGNGPNPQLPLKIAATWNRLDAVKLLVDAGANPTPGLAGAGCKAPIVAELLAHGADPNVEHPLVSLILNKRVAGEPLFDACLETAKLLINHGAQVDPPNGPSPLSLAVSANAQAFVALFLDSGADVNAVPSGGEASLLLQALRQYAISYSCVAKTGQECPGLGPYLPMVVYLLERGANPNQRDPDRWDEADDQRMVPYMSGYTPLSLAARYGLYPAAKVLLERGADPTIPREDGALPARIAQDNGHSETAALIRDYRRGG